MSQWLGILSQNLISYPLSSLSWFLDINFIIIFFILGFVFLLSLKIFFTPFLERIIIRKHNLELFWTLSPGFVILLLGVPSIKLLYSFEAPSPRNLTIKTTAHQWYWTYDYRNFNNILFDSFLLPAGESFRNTARLLDTDNRLVLPLGTTRNIITSEDVLHRWALPSLGLKIDATPGRINTIFIKLFLPGIYFGQCSEICGANHSFIPITLEATTFLLFKLWAVSFLTTSLSRIYFCQK